MKDKVVKKKPSIGSHGRECAGKEKVGELVSLSAETNVQTWFIRFGEIHVCSVCAMCLCTQLASKLEEEEEVGGSREYCSSWGNDKARHASAMMVHVPSTWGCWMVILFLCVCYIFLFGLQNSKW